MGLELQPELGAVRRRATAQTHKRGVPDRLENRLHAAIIPDLLRGGKTHRRPSVDIEGEAGERRASTKATLATGVSRSLIRRDLCPAHSVPEERRSRGNPWGGCSMSKVFFTLVALATVAFSAGAVAAAPASEDGFK